MPSIRLANVYRSMWLGFGINFVSGLMLLAAYPANALTNWVFFAKMGLVVLAMWVLERLKGELAVVDGHTREVGAPARALAMLSLFVWAGTILAGRYLAYTHHILLASDAL